MQKLTSLVDEITNYELVKRMFRIYIIISIVVGTVLGAIDLANKAMHFVPILGPIFTVTGYSLVFTFVVCVFTIFTGGITFYALMALMGVLPKQYQDRWSLTSLALAVGFTLFNVSEIIAVVLFYFAFLVVPFPFSLLLITVAFLCSVIFTLANFLFWTVGMTALTSFLTMPLIVRHRPNIWQTGFHEGDAGLIFRDRALLLTMAGIPPIGIVMGIGAYYSQFSTSLKDVTALHVYQWVGSVIVLGPALYAWRKLKTKLKEKTGQTDL